MKSIDVIEKVKPFQDAIAWGRKSCEDFDHVDWFALYSEKDIADFKGISDLYAYSSMHRMEYSIFQNIEDAIAKYNEDIQPYDDMLFGIVGSHMTKWTSNAEIYPDLCDILEYSA